MSKSTNYEDMAETSKRYVVRESVSDTLVSEPFKNEVKPRFKTDKRIVPELQGKPCLIN